MNYFWFIGIDLGKTSFDASILSNDEQEIAHHQFKNSDEGMTKMMAWLASYDVDTTKSLFCAENMGKYTSVLALFSVENKLNLSLACPLDIKHSAGLTRGKSDRIDALRIAQYAQRKCRTMKLYTLPESTLVKLRNWLNLRNIHIKNKVALENQLSTFKSDVVVDREIISYSESAIAESKQKIAELEKKIEAVIDENVSVKRNYTLLKSVIGIGMINAALLLCTTDNFTRFETPRQYASYCGVAPFEHSSGTSVRGKTRTSSIANIEIKTHLTNAAVSAMSADPQLRQYYHRKLAEGKHKASIINAIRFKLIARCFAVVRRQIPFVKLVA